MLGLIFSAFKLLGGAVSGLFGVETAKITAQAEVETAAIQGMAQVETRWWFVATMIPAFSLPFAVYYGKLLIWDKVFKLGITDPLSTDLNHIGMIIITGLFLQAIFK